MNSTLPDHTVSATQLQRHIGIVMKRVLVKGEHLLVSNNGFPVAVLLPVQDYEALRTKHSEPEQT
jgi:prevent-host-death family protein